MVPSLSFSSMPTMRGRHVHPHCTEGETEVRGGGGPGLQGYLVPKRMRPRVVPELWILSPAQHMESLNPTQHLLRGI